MFSDLNYSSSWATLHQKVPTIRVGEQSADAVFQLHDDNLFGMPPFSRFAPKANDTCFLCKSYRLKTSFSDTCGDQLQKYHHNYNYCQIINKYSRTFENWAHPWAWALRSQGGSGGAGWRARSLGEGGGSLSGTGYPRWWGTSRSDARQIAPWHTHRTSRTGRQAHKQCCYHTYLLLN